MSFACLVAGAMGFAACWSYLTVTRPAETVLIESRSTLVEARSGEVQSSISSTASARWEQTPIGVNRAAGIVTGIALVQPSILAPGEVLFSVDLRPVVVAQGEVPSFRSVESGTVGADVSQLQSMLASLGYFDGAVDGRAGDGTVRAIKAWQEDLGVPVTGSVAQGDIVYVPALANRIGLDSSLISVGATLSGGEAAMIGFSEAPVFTLPVTETQSRLIESGLTVEILAPDGSTWESVTAARTTDPTQGNVSIELDAVGDGSICGSNCDLVPTERDLVLSAQVVLVPKTSGIVLPTAAIKTSADGVTVVVDDDGQRREVDVVAAAKGMSVVTGVQVGDRVRLSDDGSPTESSAP